MKKDLTTEKPEIDNELEFEDFDFDMDEVEPKDDRSPVQKVAGKFVEGATNRLSDTEFITDIIKKVLPEQYGKAFDMADQLTTSAKNEIKKGLKEIRPAAKDFIYNAKALTPKDSYLEKKLSSIENWISSFDESREKTDDKKIREENINLVLGEVFKQQIEQTQQQAAKDTLDRGIESTRFKSNIKIISSIERGVSALTQYQNSITANFQKKSLEIQLRTYFINMDMMEHMKKSHVESIAELKSITKNTALPEFVKITKAEAFKENSRNRIINAFSSSFFKSSNEMIEGIGKNLRGMIGNKMSSIADAFSQGASGLGMAGQLNDALSMDMDNMSFDSEPREKSGFEKYGGFIADLLGGLGIESLANKLGKKGRAYLDKNKTIGGKARDIGLFLDDLPARLEEYRRSDSGEYDYDADVKKQILNKLGSFIKELIPSTRTSTFVEGDKMANINQPAIFNNQTNKSINEIIPGYLARIFREVQSLRTGKSDIALTEYDFHSNKFTTKDDLISSIKEKVVSKSTKDYAGYNVERIIEIVAKDETLSDQDKNQLKKMLINSAAAGETTDVKKFMDTAYYNKRGMSEVSDKFAALFSRAFGDTEELESKDKQIAFSRGFRDLRDSIKLPKKEIQQYINAGQLEPLKDSGLVTVDSSGNVSLNMKKIIELYTPDEESTSDYYKKDNIKALSGSSALSVVNSMPITKWDYKEGFGNNAKDMVGPMAQVAQKATEGQASNGKTVNLTALNGYNMAAIQELDKRQRAILEHISNTDEKGIGDLPDNSTSILIQQLETQKQILTKMDDISGFGVNFGNIKFGGIKDKLKNKLTPYFRKANREFHNVKDDIKYLAKRQWEKKDEYKDKIKQWWDKPSPMMDSIKGKASTFIDETFKKVKGFGDVYLIGEKSPRIILSKLKNGEYYKIMEDGKAKLITSVEEITDTIYDRMGNVVLSKDDIKNTFVNTFEQGKSVFSKLTSIVGVGFSKGIGFTKSFIPPIYNSIINSAKKQLTRINDFMDSPTDIYIKGQTNPRLIGLIMKNGGYFSLNTKKPVTKPSQIDGPVCDAQGNVILTKEEIEQGIVDKYGNDLSSPLRRFIGTGLSVVKSLATKSIKIGKDLLNKGLAKVKQMRMPNFDMLNGFIVGESAKQTVDLLTEIRDMLSSHFGYSDDFVGQTKPREDQEDKKQIENKQPQAATPIEVQENKPTNTQYSKENKSKQKLIDKKKKSINKQNKKIKQAFNDTDGDGNRQGSWRDMETGNKKNAEFEKAKAVAPKYENTFDVIGKKLSGIKDTIGSIVGGVGSLVGKKGKMGKLAALAGVAAGAAGIDTGQAGGGVADTITDAADLASTARGAGTATTVAQGAGAATTAAEGAAAAGAAKKPGLLRRGFGLLGRGAKAVYNSPIGKGSFGMLKGAARMVPMALRGIGTVGGLALRGGLMLGGGALGAAGAAAGGILGTALAGTAALMASPIVMGATAAYATYKIFKYLTRNSISDLGLYRYVQYGFDAEDNQYVSKILGLESYLEQNALVFGKGGDANLTKLKPDMVKEVFSLFDIDTDNQEQIEKFQTWFQYRFKPIFLQHESAVFKVDKEYKLSTVDDLKNDKKLQYFKSVKMENGPYDIVVSPFPDMEALPSGAAEVAAYYGKQLPKLEDKKDEGYSLKEMITNPWRTIKDGYKGLVDIKNKAMQKLSDGYNAAKDWASEKLNSAKDWVSGKLSGVKDWLGEKVNEAKKLVSQTSNAVGKAFGNNISNLDSIRFRMYGLMDMDRLKVIALRNMEEKLFKFVKFEGNGAATISMDVKDALDMFKMDFGIASQTDKMAMRWYNWFSNRFLKVYLEYCGSLKAQLGKATIDDFGVKNSQALEIANRLNAVNVWGVKDSPWDNYELNSFATSVEPFINLIRQKVNDDKLAEEKAQKDKEKSKLAKEQVQANKEGKLTDSTKTDANRLASAKPSGAMPGPDPMYTPKNPTTDEQYKNGPKFAAAGSASGAVGDTSGNAGASSTPTPTGTGEKLDKIPAPQGAGYKAVEPTIREAAKATGVKEDTMLAVAAVESGFNPGATPKGAGMSSSAKGLYQFLDGTWKGITQQKGAKYDITPSTSPFDARANALMGGEFIKQNTNIMKSVVPEVGPTEAYMAHFLGPGGAKQFFSMDKNEVAATKMPKAAAANVPIFYDRGRPRSAGEVYSLMSNKLSKVSRAHGLNLDIDGQMQTKGSSSSSTAIAQEQKSVSSVESTPMKSGGAAYGANRASNPIKIEQRKPNTDIYKAKPVETAVAAASDTTTSVVSNKEDQDDGFTTHMTTDSAWARHHSSDTTDNKAAVIPTQAVMQASAPIPTQVRYQKAPYSNPSYSTQRQTPDVFGIGGMLKSAADAIAPSSRVGAYGTPNAPTYSRPTPGYNNSNNPFTALGALINTAPAQRSYGSSVPMTNPTVVGTSYSPAPVAVNPVVTSTPVVNQQPSIVATAKPNLVAKDTSSINVNQDKEYLNNLVSIDSTLTKSLDVQKEILKAILAISNKESSPALQQSSPSEPVSSEAAPINRPSKEVPKFPISMTRTNYS